MIYPSYPAATTCHHIKPQNHRYDVREFNWLIDTFRNHRNIFFLKKKLIAEITSNNGNEN